MFELINLSDLKAFIIEHNLITYSVSWVVAVTFTLFLQSAVGDILLPSMYYTFQAIKMGLGFTEKTEHVDSIFEKVNKINVANFLKEAISFTLILLVLYIIIKDIINNWVKPPSGVSGGLIGSSSSSSSSTKPVSSSSSASSSGNNTSITQQPYYFSSTGVASSSG